MWVNQRLLYYTNVTSRRTSTICVLFLDRTSQYCELYHQKCDLSWFVLPFQCGKFGQLFRANSSITRPPVAAARPHDHRRVIMILFYTWGYQFFTNLVLLSIFYQLAFSYIILFLHRGWDGNLQLDKLILNNDLSDSLWHYKYFWHKHVIHVGFSHINHIFS
jgi:hypothetical protein